MNFSLPNRIPEISYEEPDTICDDGEWVVYPMTQGTPFSLQFISPYEPFFQLAESRLSPLNRPLNIWLYGYLPALYRALETRYAIRGIVKPEGLVIQDMSELDTGMFMDHLTLRRKLDVCRALQPPFASLGPVGNRRELLARLRGLYATGTLVEARQEDDGYLKRRLQLRVEQSSP